MGDGFAVAEAMDTAQRGMGLSWWLARELIASSAERAAARRAAGRYADLACGAGTDHLAATEAHSITKITDAYSVQLEFVQSAGAGVILMASRALAAAARGPRDYLDVYGALLKQASLLVILHRPGECSTPRCAATGAAGTSSPPRRPCLSSSTRQATRSTA